MKRKVYVILLFGIALLFMAAAFGEIGVVKAKGATVPFKVDCVTYPEVVGGGLGLGYFVLEIPADCIGTHLGNSDWYADSFVDISTPPPPFPQTGEMVFTAANGAQLVGTFSGLAAPNNIGGFDYWGTYQITGGTGRFSGASGSGTYYGGADGETGVLTFEGTLMNP